MLGPSPKYAGTKHSTETDEPNGFDVSSISPNATGVEVLGCDFEKSRIFRLLKAVHQIRAVMRSGEYGL